MKNFVVYGRDENMLFHFPTSLNDITPEYLAEVTEEVNVPEHYTLIGLVHKAPIHTVIFTFKQKKNGVDSQVIPIFVKHGGSEMSGFNNTPRRGNVLIIPPSSLQFAYHVNCPNNVLSINYLTNYLDDDKTAVTRAAKDNFIVYFLEFKIIANTEIKGFYANRRTIKNPGYMEVIPHEGEGNVTDSTILPTGEVPTLSSTGEGSK